MINYIQNEMEALEREQNQIDEQAALMEKELRRVMETGSSFFFFLETGLIIFLSI